ncbi:hypothetical protein V8J36_21195 [Frigidibacter sp. MR17.14]|uniref:aspartate/glutamate racemase family protein n=1 Tax=Frigidibacter sp. MR17.14 TaxID=3126509 RepID=UPI0030131756
MAIDPILEAAARLWPEAEVLSLLDESLAADIAAAGTVTSALGDRIAALADHATAAGAEGVLFTCSSFGAPIEAVAARSAVPVLKPNEAMFEAAFEAGQDIAMIYTFPPAREGMVAEFEAEATRRGATVRLRAVFCDGALATLRAGDVAAHDRLIAETARGLGSADAILLAQFSMASAAGAAAAASGRPVLASPETAVAKLRARVEGRRVGAC